MIQPRTDQALPRQRPRLYRLLTLMLMLLPAISPAAEFNVDTLLGNLAQVRSDHAYFTETKSIALLKTPVQSAGELFYTAPDHLEKRTLTPTPETMILDHDTLLIERGRHRQRLRLQDYPALAAFIDSIRSTLAGDRGALERNYRLNLDGTAQGWMLELLPTNRQIRAVVRRIVMTGTGTAIDRIDITQADGDSAQMRIDKSPAP